MRPPDAQPFVCECVVLPVLTFLIFTSRPIALRIHFSLQIMLKIVFYLLNVVCAKIFNMLTKITDNLMANTLPYYRYESCLKIYCNSELFMFCQTHL